MILDGKKIAKDIKDEVKARLSGQPQRPRLAVILIGEDEASRVYVHQKEKVCDEVGTDFMQIDFPAAVPIEEVKEKIMELNADSKVSGILLQLPLPYHDVRQMQLISQISPQKDVDGLHPLNLGRLFSTTDRQEIGSLLVPATARAVLRLVKKSGIDLIGRKAVIVGRSNLVGKPLAHLLLLEDMTVTVCHSRTNDLDRETSQADVLIAAAGVPALIKGDYVKKNAVVIDVGISCVGKKLTGDVDFEDVVSKVDWITPVPGGVGPVTVACLLENVLLANATRATLC